DEPRHAALERARRRERHAAILERARRIRALPLEPELDAEPLAESRRAQERRVALAEGDGHAAITGATNGRPMMSGEETSAASAPVTAPTGASCSTRSSAARPGSRCCTSCAMETSFFASVVATCPSTPG